MFEGFQNAVPYGNSFSLAKTTFCWIEVIASQRFVISKKGVFERTALFVFLCFGFSALFCSVGSQPPLPLDKKISLCKGPLRKKWNESGL